MAGRLARAATLVALLATATARAAIDIEIRSGDKVTGTISPASEVETVRFRAPKGAVISVKATAAKKGPQIHLQLKDPAGFPLTSADGKSASITKQTASVSGLYSVEVTSKDGVTTGDYTIAVTWKSPTSFGGQLTVPAAGTTDVAFSADAGATATFSVKAAKKSSAAPTLASWTKPDATVDTLSRTSQKRTIASTGDCVLTVASVAGGGVLASVKIKPPAASRRKYALTTATIGAGDSAFSAIVGPDGGAVAAPIVAPGQPGAQLDGAAVGVPAGALPVGTSIVVATAPDIAPSGTQAGAGPTVFFGPEGLQFGTKADPKTVTVTIPIDPSFSGATDQLTIYTRDAKGVVTAVPKPYTFDLLADTVSFSSSHFSSFRAVSPASAQPGNFVTVARASGVRGICNAFDPSPVTATRTILYAATGAGDTVAAVRLPVGATQFTTETWVGGGTQTTTPAARAQFQFVDPVNAVYADPAGVLYVGTTTQVFRVDPTTGTVTLVAGTGAYGDTGDGGSPLLATFTGIAGILADAAGDVYVADGGSHRIRFISVQSEPTVFAWAGDGQTGIGADGGSVATTAFVGPTALSFAPGSGLYVADGSRIRRLDPFNPSAPINATVAGDPAGGGGSTGDGGAPTAALFEYVSSISPYVDPVNPNDDVLAVADFDDSTVRLVDFTKATVRLVAGAHDTSGFNGDDGSTPGLLNAPDGVAASAGLVFVSDDGNGRIRAITNP